MADTASLKAALAPRHAKQKAPPPKQAAPLVKHHAKKKTSHALAIHKPQPPQAPKTMLEVIAEAARDPKVDVQKFKELNAMRVEEEKRLAEIAYSNALADVQAEVPNIVKDKAGDRNIRFASLPAVSRAVNPLFRNHGFALSFSMIDCPNVDVYRIALSLRHRQGHKELYWVDIPVSITGPAGKPIMTKAQGSGSAISFGRRYLKCMVLDITIVDEDDNGAGGAPPETIDSEELQDLNAKMIHAHVDLQAFLTYFRISALPDLPKARLSEALKLVAKKEKAEAQPQ